MKTANNRILNKNQLSKLVNRFSKSFVIEEMERNLRQGKQTELLVNDIDDNGIIKSAILKEDTLKDIADSINKSGLSNPLVVRPKKGYYEIVFGRKRLLACKHYKIPKAPVVIINVSDEEMLLMLLADNREQRDGNIVEMALILDSLSKKFNYSQKTLSEVAHQSRSQITNILRMLNLPKHIIDDLSINKLSYGHAKAIASLPETKIENLVKKIYQDNLSVRETERIVQNYKNSNDIETTSTLLKKYKCVLNEREKQLIIKFNSENEKLEFIKEVKK